MAAGIGDLNLSCINRLSSKSDQHKFLPLKSTLLNGMVTTVKDKITTKIIR